MTGWLESVRKVIVADEVNPSLSCYPVKKGVYMSGKNPIGPDTVVAQIEELVSSDLDGETVMMSVENGKYYGMDAIGSRVWALIKRPRSVAELCDILLTEFKVDRERCEKDVLIFLNKMAEDNLIRIVHASVG